MSLTLEQIGRAANETYRELFKWTPGSRLVFGHVVNHREPKGTRFVLDAVHKARMLGGDFGFIFAERLPHTQALQLYNYIDVLLEQFIIGWYGLQACEFALMKKPVVAWLADESGPPLVPDDLWQDIPFINASRDNLCDVILDVISMPREQLQLIGQRGYEFVTKYHSDIQITSQVLKDLLKEEE